MEFIETNAPVFAGDKQQFFSGVPEFLIAGWRDGWYIYMPSTVWDLEKIAGPFPTLERAQRYLDMITWDKGHTECLRMPDKYIREMVADWRGAGRALGKPDIVAWYVSNRDNIQLHPDTRKLVEYYLHYNP